MSMSRKATSTRRRRVLEVALLLGLAACLAVALSPMWKAQEQERADRRARAQAMLDGANETVATLGRVAPAVVGVTFTAVSGGPPGQLLRSMAPLEIEEATQALKRDPTDQGSLIRRGELYLTTEQYEKAVADFSRALEGKAVYEALCGRSTALARLGRFEEALSDATAAVECDEASYSEDAFLALGYVYVGLRQDEKAVEAYGKALEIYDDEQAYYGRGVALRRLGRLAEAERDFAKARVYDPNFRVSWNVPDDPGRP